MTARWLDWDRVAQVQQEMLESMVMKDISEEWGVMETTKMSAGSHNPGKMDGFKKMRWMKKYSTVQDVKQMR